MTRAVARGLARWLVLVLLLAQWTVASHACVPGHGAVAAASASEPVRATASAAGVQAVSAALPMPDCDGMDGMTAYGQDLPCAEHCKFGDQRDSPASLVVLGGFPPIAHARLPGDDAALLQRVVVGRTAALTLAPPPHAILHCVRRT